MPYYTRDGANGSLGEGRELARLPCGERYQADKDTPLAVGTIESDDSFMLTREGAEPLLRAADPTGSRPEITDTVGQQV